MENSHKPAHMSDVTTADEAYTPRTSWRGVARRAILCATCAATAATLMFPSASFAAEWVNVDGTQYDQGAAAGDAAGTWSWDGADDMRLNGYDGGPISAAGRLDVTYTGDNTVTNGSDDGYGIVVKDGENEKAELNISGDEGDSLTVESGDAAIASNGDLSISGSGTVSASSKTGDGIGTTGDLSVEDANVEAKGHDGIYSAGSTTIKGSVVNAEGTEAGIFSYEDATIDNSKVKASATSTVENNKYGASGIWVEEGDVAIKNGSLVEAIGKNDGSASGIYSYNHGEAGGGHITISDSTVTAIGETTSDGKPGIGIWALTDDLSSSPASVSISRSNVSASGTDSAIVAAAFSETDDDPALGTIAIKDSTLAAPQGARLAEYKVAESDEAGDYVEYGMTFVVSDLSPEGVITDPDKLDDIAIRDVTIEANEEQKPEVKPASAVTPAGSVTKRVIPQTGDASPAGLVASAIAGASALAAGIFMTRRRED